MARSRLLVLAVAAFVVGAGLMIPFENTITRIFGVASLFAFVVCGAFLIANPADLSGGDDERR